jgi:pimeloyl-ACP methyl ester carboxylesterase
MTTTNQVPDRRYILRRFGVAMLGAALISATACGNSATDTANATNTADASDAATTTATPAATTTTVPTPPSSTTIATVPATATTVPAPETAPRPTATRDELVGVEGNRLHIRCTGSGAKTVLLIAGFEEGAESWSKVEPAISASARVCSYDRPGTGTSDPPTSTPTFATQATDLHALLTTVGEPGPYVVVGHSFGGAEAVTFASQFAAEVTGLVLIDASPVTWPAALCAVADDGTQTAADLRSFCTALSDPNRNAEHLDAFSSFTEVSGITTLGSLPMAVITAVDRQFPGLGASELAGLTDKWNQGQQLWSGLSSAAHVVPVADTSHHIQLDQPAVVIDEITRLLP